jgi:hypothetical protein
MTRWTEYRQHPITCGCAVILHIRHFLQLRINAAWQPKQEHSDVSASRFAAPRLLAQEPFSICTISATICSFELTDKPFPGQLSRRASRLNRSRDAVWPRCRQPTLCKSPAKRAASPCLLRTRLFIPFSAGATGGRQHRMCQLQLQRTPRPRHQGCCRMIARRRRPLRQGPRNLRPRWRPMSGPCLSWTETGWTSLRWPPYASSAISPSRSPACSNT